MNPYRCQLLIMWACSLLGGISFIFYCQYRLDLYTMVFLCEVSEKCFDFRKLIEMAEQYSIYHTYWVNKKPINPPRLNYYGNITFSQSESDSGSTIYKCTKVYDVMEKNFFTFYAMKVIPYKNNIREVSKASYKQSCKNYQQIKTEFQTLTLLKNCHRVATLVQMINQNQRRKDNQQFFHDFLGKPKHPNQNYVCFVTEFCNQGNLNEIIERNKGGLSEDQVVYYSAQIIEGLIQLKKKNILHRDLRLCNILVHNNEIKFSDFDTAFIGGLSTYKNVKNGIDNSTAPPQIITLSSMADDELKDFNSDKLYYLQQKCDIYFFGLALFKMIFGYDCPAEMVEENLLNQINSKIVNQKFSKDLLTIMKQCVEQNVDQRMDLITLVEKFSLIEKNKYFVEKTISKLYLSEDPAIFVSGRMADTQNEIIEKLNHKYSATITPITEIDFAQQLQISTKNHMTTFSVKIFESQNIENQHALWRQKEYQKNNEQHKYIQLVDQFIRSLNTRSFYYEFLYYAILSINMRSIKSRSLHHLVKTSKKQLENEITNVLGFLFELLLERPYSSDKYYNPENLSYERRKLLNTMMKSDIFQNKKDCYKGKANQFKMEAKTVTKIKKDIQQYYVFQQVLLKKFEPKYLNFKRIIANIDSKVKYLLKDTICKLGFAFQNRGGSKNTGNIKEILFILIILEQLKLENLKKNQIVAIWKELDPLLNEQVQLQSYQVEVFIKSYRLANPEVNEKANLEKNIISTTFFGIGENLDEYKKSEGQQDGQNQSYNLNINEVPSSQENHPIKLSVSDIGYKDNSCSNPVSSKFELSINNLEEDPKENKQNRKAWY